MIVESRMKGVSFIDDLGREKINADQIMLRCASFSGCPLPNTEFFADIISEELVIFISTCGYGGLTQAEILLAIRINYNSALRFPKGLEVERVEFFGNCFNVSYVAKLLANYMQIRNMLDRKFQNYLDGYTS